MEAVASDFLRDLVELAVSKFFRVIRSVKGSAMRDISVRSPELCAEFLSSLIAKIAADLSVPSTMLAVDNYFRFKLSRRSLVATTVSPAKVEKKTYRETDSEVQQSIGGGTESAKFEAMLRAFGLPARSR